MLDYLPMLEGADPDPQALSDKCALLSSFGQAQLVISGSETFWMSLKQSAQARLQNLRSDVANCAKAQQRIVQLNAIIQSWPLARCQLTLSNAKPLYCADTGAS